MRFTLLTLLLITFCAAGLSQKSISGQVYDEATFAAVKFAHIGVLGNPTIVAESNIEGKFRIEVPNTLLGDTLFINAPGYKLYKVALSEAGNSGSPGAQRFLLKSQNKLLNRYMFGDSTFIDETQLFQDRLVAGKEIIEGALERVPFNFPTSNYAYSGFFRAIKSQDGKATRMLEAMLDVNDEGYLDQSSQKIKEVVRIKELRRSDDNSTLPYLDENGIAHILKHNNVRYPAIDINIMANFQFFDFYLDSIIYSGKDMVYKILLKANEKYQRKTGGFFLVKVDNLAFMEYEYFAIGESKGLEATSLKVKGKYKERNGKMYLDYLYDYHKNNNIKGKAIVGSLERESMFQTTEVLDFQMHTITNNAITKKTDLFSLSFPYNSTYWKGIDDVVFQHQITEDQLKSLESSGTLEQQFRRWSNKGGRR